jgi:hypothetical protein
MKTVLDCGALGELDVVVEYEYSPAEKPDYEEGHMTYPGCDECYEITSVKAVIDTETVELLPLISEWDVNQLEIECKESME